MPKRVQEFQKGGFRFRKKAKASGVDDEVENRIQNPVAKPVTSRPTRQHDEIKAKVEQRARDRTIVRERRAYKPLPTGTDFYRDIDPAMTNSARFAEVVCECLTAGTDYASATLDSERAKTDTRKSIEIMKEFIREQGWRDEEPKTTVPNPMNVAAEKRTRVLQESLALEEKHAQEWEEIEKELEEIQDIIAKGPTPVEITAEEANDAVSDDERRYLDTMPDYYDLAAEVKNIPNNLKVQLMVLGQRIDLCRKVSSTLEEKCDTEMDSIANSHFNRLATTSPKNLIRGLTTTTTSS
eukprot:Clim_evm11s222 gene=Clim_evmTU11s222